MKIQQAAGVVVRNREHDEILMVHNRWRRCWEYPGGGARPDDHGSGRLTAQRELLEETGLRVRVRWLLGVDDVPRTLRRPLRYATYAALVSRSDVDRVGVKLSSEHDDWRWMHVDAVAGAPDLLTGLRDRLPRLLAPHRWPYRLLQDPANDWLPSSVAPQQPMW